MGVGIHALDLASAIELMESAIAAKTQGYVCLTDAHSIIEAQDNPAYLKVLNQSLLTLSDGRPAVWIGRMQGCTAMDQVPGPELFLRFCEISARKGYSQFLYGGAPGVAEHLGRVLLGRYPALNIVGTYSPPFRPLTESEEKLLAAIFLKLKPDVTWIGLGAPKQDLFMAQHLGRLDTTLMVGVGAAFDMHSGRVNDAPPWLKPLGLAWLHRLVQEPKRLWKRYVNCIPRFLWSVTLQLLRIRRYELKPKTNDASDEISRATT